MLFLSLQEKTIRKVRNKPACQNNPVLLYLEMVTQTVFKFVTLSKYSPTSYPFQRTVSDKMVRALVEQQYRNLREKFYNESIILRKKTAVPLLLPKTVYL